MANVGGWLFTVLAFGGFYVFWRRGECSHWVLLAGMLAIGSHHVLSALNVIYGPFPFAALDAYSFHLNAVKRLEMPEVQTWSLGSDMYESLLASLYRLFGESLWLGQTLSIAMYALSCVVLLKFTQVFRLNQLLCAAALLLFGLLPSSLLYGSFTLRETFFTAFFMLAAYAGHFAIYAENRQRQWQLWALAAFSFVLMGLFHMILLVYAIVISALLFFIIYAQQTTWKQWLVQAVVCLVAVGLLLFFVKEALPVHLSDDYFAMLRLRMNGEIVPIPHAISIYHQTINASGAATQYDAALEFTTWGRMVFVLMYSYAFYLGWPVSGDYSQLSTWVLMFEAVFRLLGLLALLLLAKKDRQWYWLVIVYVSLTFLWNIGTSNHGQALRHHFMTEWVLILAMLSYAQQLFKAKSLPSHA